MGERRQTSIVRAREKMIGNAAKRLASSRERQINSPAGRFGTVPGFQEPWFVVVTHEIHVVGEGACVSLYLCCILRPQRMLRVMQLQT